MILIAERILLRYKQANQQLEKKLDPKAPSTRPTSSGTEKTASTDERTTAWVQGQRASSRRHSLANNNPS
jgi:hypothetical protein